MKRPGLAVAAVCLIAGSAIAGPDETTRQLMNDPVSMIDMGVLKGEMLLRAKGLGFMSFDWESNRFHIFNFFFNGDYPDQRSAEAECASWVADIRSLANVSTETGKAIYAHSAFAEFFSHEGFLRTGEPKTLYTDLDKLFVLKCSAYAAGASAEVTAPLLGTSYSLEKSAEK